MQKPHCVCKSRGAIPASPSRLPFPGSLRVRPAPRGHHTGAAPPHGSDPLPPRCPGVRRGPASVRPFGTGIMTAQVRVCAGERPSTASTRGPPPARSLFVRTAAAAAAAVLWWCRRPANQVSHGMRTYSCKQRIELLSDWPSRLGDITSKSRLA